MPKQDFLALTDLSRGDLLELLATASALKAGGGTERPLAGKSLAMVFAKSSTRTRVSFEAGMYQLGGHGMFLSSRDLQLGRGEPIRDTARVLSEYVDGIMIRTFDHADVVELARHASVPVINGLTDHLHPCQLLADLLTVQECFGALEDHVVCWIGDGNNMANSWLNAAAVAGFELRLACPKQYMPDPEVLAHATGKAKVSVGSNPSEAVCGAHVVTTDVWASMGQEGEAAQRAEAFAGFSVTQSLMEEAHPDAIFLHCLPAHRGEEVEEEVFEGAQSRVFQEAGNRLHAQKALLLKLLG